MIKRLVKMKFAAQHIDGFKHLFEERRATIAAFEGCQHLELWQDAHNPQVFFTYSIWDSEEHLNHYRYSAFFKETWRLTKALFEADAEAWSVLQQ